MHRVPSIDDGSRRTATATATVTGERKRVKDGMQGEREREREGGPRGARRRAITLPIVPLIVGVATATAAAAPRPAGEVYPPAPLVLDGDERRKLLLLLPVVPHLTLLIDHRQARTLTDRALCTRHGWRELLCACRSVTGFGFSFVARLVL